MSAHTQLRLASLCAAAYGLLLASGILHHFQRSGSFRWLADTLSRPSVWLVLVVALLVTVGLWKRHAWAWWLGLAGAGYEVFRIVSGWIAGRTFPRLPGFATLLALAILALLLLLLLQRKARLGANR